MFQIEEEFPVTKTTSKGDGDSNSKPFETQMDAGVRAIFSALRQQQCNSADAMSEGSGARNTEKAHEEDVESSEVFIEQPGTTDSQAVIPKDRKPDGNVLERSSSSLPHEGKFSNRNADIAKLEKQGNRRILSESSMQNMNKV